MSPRLPDYAWSFDADGKLFRLASEALRIGLAHLFDLTGPRFWSVSMRSRAGSAQSACWVGWAGVGWTGSGRVWLVTLICFPLW